MDDANLSLTEEDVISMVKKNICVKRSNTVTINIQDNSDQTVEIFSS